MKFIGISYDPRRIIGVVPDLDDENIIPSPAMMIYQPVDQEGWQGRLFVRAKQDPYALVPGIAQTIHQMSADQPVERASTLEDIRAEVLAPDKLNAIVFGGFAAVALLISVVGVSGVLAFSVSGRTREFGIRMALGAQPSNILRGVLLDGLAIAEIADRRAVDRHVRVVARGDRVGEVVAAAVVTGGKPQLRSMNFRIETWSAYSCEMCPALVYGDTTISGMRVPSPKKSSGCT
jgi:hypothetical protein